MILKEIDEINPLHAKKIQKNRQLFDNEFDEAFNPMIENFSRVLNKQSLNIHYAVKCYIRMITEITLEMINYSRCGTYSNASYSDVEQRVYADNEKFNDFKISLFISELLWPQHFLIFLHFTKLFRQYGEKGNRFIDIGGSHGQYLQYIMNAPLKERSALLFTNPLSLDMVNWFVSSSEYDLIYEDSADKEFGKYDWVTMGETLEHTENPVKYISLAIQLLRRGGFLFVTAPINAPAIDHVFCYRNKEEVIALFKDKDLTLLDEFQVYAEESQKLNSKASSIWSALFRIN
ncbi:MAG: methyltransferase domain-containing protein [Ignavibacteriaceae bacterium]|nr:methyltransferase domain-containing protein [Ignavibacteriaceae bacterium]